MAIVYILIIGTMCGFLTMDQPVFKQLLVGPRTRSILKNEIRKTQQK